MIYVFALIALLVVAAMGLDGLRARFGGAEVQGIKPPQYSIQSTGGQQPANPADTTAGGGGGQATPTVGAAPPPPVTSPQPVSTISPPPPSQAQGGTITGETGTPFYIVQSGDTLWAISTRFGVDLDALRSLNNLTDDIIYPDQVLYLPTPNAPAPAPTPDPGTADVPSMPNTGIIKKP